MYFSKECHMILIGIALWFQITLNCLTKLTILDLLNHDYKMSFCKFFVSAFYVFQCKALSLLFGLRMKFPKNIIHFHAIASEIVFLNFPFSLLIVSI